MKFNLKKLFTFSRLTIAEKRKRALIGGIAGLLIGFWMIFIARDNFGFIPAILGSLLLIWQQK